MKRGFVAVISVCLNLALAGVAFHLVNRRVTTTPPARTPTILQTFCITESVTNHSATPVTYVTNRFDWLKVEADDWELLAANLRAVGCPEQTVREIIFARANRAMDKINSTRWRKPSFWTVGRRLEQHLRGNELLTLAERDKIRERVQRAVGGEFMPDKFSHSLDFEELALTRFIFGPMPEESYQRLIATFTRFDTRESELNTRVQNVWLEEDIAEMKQYHTRMRQELAAALTPGQLEEMTARSTAIASFEHVLFEATDFSPAEVRQIALLRAKITDPLDGDSIPFSSHSMNTEEEAQFQLTVRQLLGDARYAQFERASKRDFQELFELGHDHNLPKDAAVKVYEIWNLTQQEIEQLRQDQSLSAAERQQRGVEMQRQTQEAVLRLLGAKACQDYLRRGGRWMTNIINL